MKELAADRLEAGIEDLELDGGMVRVVGTDQQVTLAEIAAGAGETLTAREEVNQTEATYPNGTHVCEVEIDPDTGDVAIVNYVIVDDFGVHGEPASSGRSGAWRCGLRTQPGPVRTGRSTTKTANF